MKRKLFHGLMQHSLHKKGIFFTLTSVTIMIFFVTLYTSPLLEVGPSGAEISNIKSVNGFIEEVKSSYLPLALKVSLFRAVDAAIDYMETETTYLSDPGTELGSIIRNGSFSGNRVMANHTVTNFSDSIISLASANYHVDLAITVHDVMVTQNSPWLVSITANVSLYADAGTRGTWNQTYQTILSNASIVGLEDPQFRMNQASFSDTAIRRWINQSYDVPSWNVTFLDDFVSSGNYTVNSNAPSYLNRFTDGQSASSCCGIESAIAPGLLATSNQEESYIDYQFFESHVACADLNEIAGGGFSHTNFKLSDTEVSSYGVSGYASALTCS